MARETRARSPAPVGGASITNRGTKRPELVQNGQDRLSAIANHVVRPGEPAEVNPAFNSRCSGSPGMARWQPAVLAEAIATPMQAANVASTHQ